VILMLLAVGGFTSLIYQITWQRLLVFSTGSTSDSVTLIVTGFMVGLGAGSLAGGYLADRCTPRARWLWLVGVELTVAVLGWASPWLFYDWFYVALQTGTWPASAVRLLGLAATLTPAVFMGASLPLAVRIVALPRDAVDRWATIAYGTNTLGAAIGALATVEWLLPVFGLTTTLHAAATLNGLCAAAAMIMAVTTAATVEGRETDVTASGLAPSSTFRFWVAASALSGFIALTLEIVWFRVLGVVMHSNSATFARLLTIMLIGIGAGALASRSALVHRWPARDVFCFVQSAVALYSVAVLSLGVAGLQRWLVFDDATLGLSRAVLGLLASLVVVVLPTFLMGVSFGCLQRAAQTELSGLGRRVGWLQLANMLGSAAGALLTGFVLLDQIGTSGTLCVIVAAGAIIAFPLRTIRGPAAAGSLVAVAAVILISVPSNAALWPALHHLPPAVIAAEDRSGTAVLLAQDDTVAVLVNGQHHSQLPYEGIHVFLGALPTLLHESPGRIAIVGIGSGGTAYAAGSRTETERIDVVEIVSPLYDALRRLLHGWPYAGLRTVLTDERFRHHVADGRAYLQRSTTGYDVIEADALLPHHSYAGHLYSREYFALMRDRLAPGGYGVTWLPTDRVLHSMRAAFPHVTVIGDVAIGSDQPVRIDASRLQQRLGDERIKTYFAAAGIDIARVFDDFLEAPIELRGPSGGELNEDLFPRDELRSVAWLTR